MPPPGTPAAWDAHEAESVTSSTVAENDSARIEAVDAFCKGNQENALKTKPKGWEADHRDIELLKLRNYTVGAKIEDGLFAREDAQERLKDMAVAMEPFVTFLNRIVMPDPGDTSDEEQEAAPEGSDVEDENEGEEESEGTD
ncbi:hypothetical protein HYQ44_016113 [Verticillium longisporum]|nr:hypothetical protein HYQ44_016113 [Verticillium longisporum]